MSTRFTPSVGFNTQQSGVSMSGSFSMPRFELGQILRDHADSFFARHKVSAQQGRVIRRLISCRTAALGGHLDSCSDCGTTRISYNSCRDRHCPKCQAGKRAEWLERRLDRLLPVPYFHLVFTLPEELRLLVSYNPNRLYALLFQAASATIKTLARDPNRLGADVGITAILHTWGQNLTFHPHLHCVVTGGGLSLDGEAWVQGNRKYFLPVRVLSKLFRGKFLGVLKALFRDQELVIPDQLSELKEPMQFKQFLNSLYQKQWVVYAKRPFGSAEQVFRYLGRYSHRVAISNQRLIEVDDDQVCFAWRDYADGNRNKIMSLEIDEFIRRFLLHVLPNGFVRIRHYGLLASGQIQTKWVRCLALLEGENKQSKQREKTWIERAIEWFGFHPLKCPHCGKEMQRSPLQARCERTHQRTIAPTNQGSLNSS
jgi:hypothetical protein